jgi:hypothetical protein
MHDRCQQNIRDKIQKKKWLINTGTYAHQSTQQAVTTGYFADGQGCSCMA